MNNLYAVVLWSKEANVYSSVKVSKIEFDREVYLDANSLVGYEFDIKLSNNSEETNPGKVIEVGKLYILCNFY